MSLNVREFMHTLAKHQGPQYTNRYRVRMPTYNLPLIEKALGYEDANGRELNVLCKSVDIPSLDLVTGVSRKAGSREAFPHATGFSVGDVNITFIETANGLVRTYMEGWFDSIIDAYGQVGFYKDIVRDIYVDSLDKEGNVTMTVRLLDCYPSIRGAYTFAEGEGAPLEIATTLKVKNYEIITGTEGKVNKVIDKVIKPAARIIGRIF